MAIMIGLGLGLLIGGLVVMWLSPSTHNPTLVNLIWWVGAVLAVFGVVILVTPMLVWVYNQVHAMLGADAGIQRIGR